MPKPDVLILLGERQVGKSTLMDELKNKAPKGNEVKFFNLEFPDNLHFFSKSDSELFNEFKSYEKLVLFFDEFHYLKNASKFFKALCDLKKNIKIIASGSSS